MMILGLVILSFCTIAISIMCICWSNEYLFTPVGKFDNGKPIMSYHLCTVPARIVGVLITFASVCVTSATLAVTITTILFKIF